MHQGKHTLTVHPDALNFSLLVAGYNLTLNVSQFVAGSECDREENLPLRDTSGPWEPARLAAAAPAPTHGTGGLASSPSPPALPLAGGCRCRVGLLGELQAAVSGRTGWVQQAVEKAVSCAYLLGG